MSINENLAAVLHRIKRERRQSFSEFAEELGIPKSSLEKYMNGEGNPRADTMEMLAERLNVPLTEIVSGPRPGQEQAETILRAAKELSSLSPERREKGLQSFLSLVSLFAEENQG